MDKHGEGGEVAEREIFSAEPEIFLLDLMSPVGWRVTVVLTS